MSASAMTFTHPDQLSHLLVNSLPEILTNSAESIFTLNHDSITKILDSKNIQIISKIRDSQLNKFAEIRSDYPANLAHTRPIAIDQKADFIQDILLLGSCIAARAPVENMHLVYVSVPNETLGHILSDKTTLSELTDVVKQLLQTTEANKREIGVLKNDIVALKNENVNLSNEVAILKALIENGDPVELDQCPVFDQNPVLEPRTELEQSPAQTNIEVQPLQVNLTTPSAAIARPVIAAVETAYAFVGNIQSPCSAYDLQNHITSNTTLTTKLSDIEELDIKSENLAFKVAVPKNKINLLISSSLFGKGIKAELYRPQRPKGAQPNINNRYRKTFRDPNPTSTSQSRPSQSQNWRRYQRSPARNSSDHSDRSDRSYRGPYRPRYDY